MAEQTGARAGEARMDAASLYREEIYTDRAAGTLRVMLPVKADGSADAARPTLFIGEAQILTNMGPLPISFEVDAKNLAEAIENYGEAAKVGIERAVRELQELRRQASSSIVLPGAGAAAGLTGGLPPGGLGGGKIKLP
ncbi:MAG: hypothetical protein M3R31_01895 [Pseudomonadota bacterium]|nr:hypothetical protein [Pseudomonadota bacterium]